MVDDFRLTLLLAESGVRQLYARYADAVWRKDSAAFGDCFAGDAVWKIAGRTVTGRADIVSLFEMTLVPSERVMMWVGIPLLDIGNGTATGRTQVTELIKRKDGSSKRTLAIYYDRFVEAAGVWRFQWHYFNLAYLGGPDLSDSYLDCMDFGPPPGMPGADDPTPVPG
jgi:ketosteroid isomerase-like protein